MKNKNPVYETDWATFIVRLKPSATDDACHYPKNYTKRFFDSFPSQQTAKNTDDTIHLPITPES
jgi:hypothetical protein